MGRPLTQNMTDRTWPRTLGGCVGLANAAYFAWAALLLIPMAREAEPNIFSLRQEMGQVFLGIVVALAIILLLGAVLTFWKGARWGLAFLILGGLAALIIATATTGAEAYLGWITAAVDLAAVVVIAIQNRAPAKKAMAPANDR